MRVDVGSAGPTCGSQEASTTQVGHPVVAAAGAPYAAAHLRQKLSAPAYSGVRKPRSVSQFVEIVAQFAPPFDDKTSVSASSVALRRKSRCITFEPSRISDARVGLRCSLGPS